MKRIFNLLAMGLVLFFWFGVLVSLIAPLPGKLNGFLPVCGVIVALLHWLQASMIKAACKRYFTVSKAEFVTVLVFGVFGMVDIRQRLKEIVDAAQRPTHSDNT
jgi:putative membrane protein